MAPDHLTPQARRENAASLAAALGIGLKEAAQALDVRILVTADSSDTVAEQIADEVTALLSRTVESVTRTAEGHQAVELVIGAAAARSSGTTLQVDIRDDRAAIGRALPRPTSAASTPPILGLLVACYASAAALYHALPRQFPFELPDPLVVDFGQLGVDIAALSRPVELDHAYLAGAGAIGNGLLWAARYLDVRGQLDIVDDDQVNSGNLNRQIWFDSADIGLLKAERLAAHAAPSFPRLRLVPRVHRLQGLPERSEGPWLRRLIVAVDSRRARRALQNEFPKEVFDASTTDIREVVVHHHIQPNATACLSCIYEPDEEEVSREQHIADHLGVPVGEVRTERIAPAAAHIIAGRFPTLVASALVGVAYDTLFKRLCSEGELRSPVGKRILAPFAFVSVLAGVLLALEIVRHLGSGSRSREGENYWRISPWHPPLARRRIVRPKQPGCAFCGVPVLSAINEKLWGSAT